MTEARQSFITRRSVIAAAAVSAVAPPALPAQVQGAGPDPIVAAIAAHRAAVAALDRAARHLSDVEEGLVDDGGQDRGSGADDDPLLIAALAAFEAACDAETSTAWALACARPGDRAAAAALLRHAGDVEAAGHDWPERPDGDGERNWVAAFHHNLAAALDTMR